MLLNMHGCVYKARLSWLCDELVISLVKAKWKGVASNQEDLHISRLYGLSFFLCIGYGPTPKASEFIPWEPPWFYGGPSLG